jgi:hypothetical protein
MKEVIMSKMSDWKLQTWMNTGAKPGADIPCTDGCARTNEVALMCRGCAERELAANLKYWDPTGFGPTGYAVDVRLPYTANPALGLEMTNWCQQEIFHLLQGLAYNHGTKAFVRADELIEKPGLGKYGPRLRLLWFLGEGAVRIPDVQIFCLFRGLLTRASEVAEESSFTVRKLSVDQIPSYLGEVLTTNLTDVEEIQRCRLAWKHARRSMCRWLECGAIPNSRSRRPVRVKSSPAGRLYVGRGSDKPA